MNTYWEISMAQPVFNGWGTIKSGNAFKHYLFLENFQSSESWSSSKLVIQRFCWELNQGPLGLVAATLIYYKNNLSLSK
jgi:hypothetical protein